MPTYKYANADHSSVLIIDDDEIVRMSCAPWVIPEGCSILPADPVVPVPLVASPRQIRQALTSIGLRAAVEASVISGTQDLKDWWDYATQFEENHPMVVAMARSLNVSEEQLHSLFVLAVSL